MNTMNAYLWIKSLHLISMVCWFAGLFYIFRLFVYHAKYKNKSDLAEAYSVMEGKLLAMIMHPALFLTVFSGSLLISLNPSVMRAGWFHAKLGAVFFLIAYHTLSVMTHRRFSRGDYWLSERACRIINEVPTIGLILIIILVVIKPL